MLNSNHSQVLSCHLVLQRCSLALVENGTMPAGRASNCRGRSKLSSQIHKGEVSLSLSACGNSSGTRQAIRNVGQPLGRLINEHLHRDVA